MFGLRPPAVSESGKSAFILSAGGAEQLPTQTDAGDTDTCLCRPQRRSSATTFREGVAGEVESKIRKTRHLPVAGVEVEAKTERQLICIRHIYK